MLAGACLLRWKMIADSRWSPWVCPAPLCAGKQPFYLTLHSAILQRTTTRPGEQVRKRFSIDPCARSFLLVPPGCSPPSPLPRSMPWEIDIYGHTHRRLCSLLVIVPVRRQARGLAYFSVQSVSSQDSE